MKVMVTATYSAPKLGGGVARYERELLPRLVPILTEAGCHVSVLALDDGARVTPGKSVDVITLPTGRDSPVWRILCNQIYTSLCSCRADVYLSLESWLPILPLWSRHNVVVLHDAHAELAWKLRKEQPSSKDLGRLLYWHAVSLRAAHASDRIITVSRFAARELSQVFRIPESKIAAIYCGVDTNRFRPIRDPDTLRQARERYSLPDKFYLFVGPSNGDKNLALLLRTFLETLDPSDPRSLPVVVTSAKPSAPPEADLLRHLEHAGKGGMFRFLGSVEDADLLAVYSSAHALLFPSLHEGFGLPPVEAMACGLPVVSSNRTSLPEVLGDAAILFDPDDTPSLLDALQAVNDGRLRQELRRRGLERAALFSWDSAARAVASEVLSCLHKRSRPGGSIAPR